MPSFAYYDVSGMTDYMNNHEIDIEDIIIRVLMKYGPIIVGVAQSLSPVRTGALKNSIMYLVDAGKLMLSIFGAVYYFKFVEYGTKFMSARRMCEMAYIQHEQQILAEIDYEIRLAAEAYNTK